jgi:hypothetical protein
MSRNKATALVLLMALSGFLLGSIVAWWLMTTFFL